MMKRCRSREGAEELGSFFVDRLVGLVSDVLTLDAEREVRVVDRDPVCHRPGSGSLTRLGVSAVCPQPR